MLSNPSIKTFLGIFILLTGLFLQVSPIFATGQQCCDSGGIVCSVPGETCQCDEKCVVGGNPPTITKAPGICVKVNPGQSFVCPWTKYFNIDDILETVANWIFYFGVIFLPLMILVGGLLFTGSAGDPKRYNLGKNIMIWSAVGLAFILFSKGMFTIMKSILVG